MIRRAIDGSLWLPRKNVELEQELDSEYIRVGKTLRWIPKLTKLDPDTIDFGESAYIVGKGPSLDKLRAKDLKNPWPILCINQSVHKIVGLGLLNRIYCFQQDSRLRDQCKANGAINIVSIYAANWYPEAYVYYPEKYGETGNTLTAVMAIKISKATNFILYAFDAITNKNLEYAKSIGMSSTAYGLRRDRFFGHKQPILNALVGKSFLFNRPLNLPQ